MNLHFKNESSIVQNLFKSKIANKNTSLMNNRIEEEIFRPLFIINIIMNERKGKPCNDWNLANNYK